MQAIKSVQLSIGLLVTLGIAAGDQPSSATRRLIANYGKLPLSFEPNQGQTDPRVQFVSRGVGYTLFISPGSATFALQDRVVRMNLVGARPMETMEPEEKLPGVTNYLTGTNSAKRPTRLPTYARARARNVYAGIDLVYYGTQGRLEYDFVLAPQADPSKIRLQFEGATPSLDASGDLVLSQDGLRFHAPVLYQTVNGFRQPVSGRFIVAANREVHFQVGSYDRNKELVIDPVLLYSSYIGGSTQQSVINAMTVNPAGQIYLTGYTNAIDYPTTTGVIQPACPAPVTGGTKCGASSSSAAFVSKISANGQSLIYSTYLGGSGNGSGVGGTAVGAGGSGSDFGTGIAVDANDNAWVVGQTNSNNFPVTADAYSLYCEPAQINSGASVVLAKGNGCGAPGPSGYNYSGTYSLFLVKLNPAGTIILYGTFLGGTNGETAAQIALDSAGDIYVAGSAYTNVPGTYAQTSYYNYPTTASAFQTQALTGGAYSAFVTEFTPDGHNLIYSSMFGGLHQNTYNNALAVNAGKIFIGGYTQDPHLPTTPGALSTTCPSASTASGPNTVCSANSPNAYVAEFDPTKSGAASLVFSTYLNGSVATQGNESSAVNALAADSAGNLYAGGYDTYTVPEGFPGTPGVLQPTCLIAHNSGQCGSGFVTKLGSTGALVWSTFYGSPSLTGGPGVSVLALDASRNVYIAANANGAGDYPLNNAVQNYTGGSAYITELSGDGSQVLFGTFYGGPNNVFPVGLTVDPAGNIYAAGYTAGGLPLTNALQSTNGGGFNEGFFAKISNPPSGPVAFVSAASSQSGAAAPGSIVSAYGTDLATATLTGTSVNILDSKGVTTPAPLFFVSAGQVNFLVPTGVATGNATITITSGDGKISSGRETIATVAPGLFVLNSAALAAADVITVTANGTQVPGNSYQVVNGAVVPLPINVGTPNQQVFLVLFGTGISGRSSLANVSVSIRGVSLPVVFAGPQGDAGLDQVNVLLPASLAGSGDTALSITVDGAISNTVHVTIL